MCDTCGCNVTSGNAHLVTNGGKLALTEDGKSDPLLVGFPDRISVLLGHKEACDTTPDGAILLMRGDNCPVQMFRIGKNVYATQFHPEGDSEGFRKRIDAYKDQLPEDFKKNINTIIDEDVKPCLRFSNSSIAKLSTRLDQFEKISTTGEL